MCSTSSFYGSASVGSGHDASPRSARRNARLERARLLAHPGHDLRPGAGAAGRRRLRAKGFPDHFKAFSTQEAALEWRREEAGTALGTTVFSRELDASGRRCYLCCHPEKMFEIIMARKINKRHFYEVIPQGEPCKLYFDLEFSLAENRHADGEAAVRLLVALVLDKLRDDFGATVETGDVVDLDSSSADKFSRHVVLNSSGATFGDNRQAGAFVRDLCAGLSPGERDKLSFLKEGRRELLVDQSVYSKNRNFRLFLCSKYGKAAALSLATRDGNSHGGGGGGGPERSTFLASLITHFDDSPTKLLRVDAAMSSEVDKRKHHHQVDRVGHHPRRPPAPCSSPFPEVDQALSSFLLPLGGRVRRALFRPELGAIEYEITGNRHCGNVGRQHRSNNVKYVVLLGTGVFFQTCHDPDCAGYKSDDRPLPLDCQPWIDLFQDEGEEPSFPGADGDPADDGMVEGASSDDQEGEEDCLLARAAEEAEAIYEIVKKGDDVSL